MRDLVRLVTRYLCRSGSLALVLFTCSAASAEEPDEDTSEPTERSTWFVHAGGYTHYSDDEDYETPNWFFGIEYKRPSDWMYGLSVFNNSFGDISEYAYVGKNFYPSSKYPGMRIKITGGVAHGYRNEHNKIFPVRWSGSWGLAIVPGVGYEWESVSVDLALLSTSGLLLLVGYEF